MRFAVFTVSLPEYTPEQAIAELRDAGYDGVEWRVTDQQPADPPGFWAGNRCTVPLSSAASEAPRIRALAEAAGLAAPNVGTYVTCEDLGAVERAMAAAVALGSPQLRVNALRYDSGQSYLRTWDRSVALYREVAALARSHGLRALVEIHHGSLIPSASSAAAFLRSFDPRDVGAIHDAGNMVYEGHESYRMGLEVLGPYLAHVHLKNARWAQVGQREDGSSAWEATWATIRGGVVDMAALFGAMRAVGYDGWVSFEDFSTERPLGERIRDNLAYIRGVAARAGY